METLSQLAAHRLSPLVFPPKWASAWGTDRHSPFPLVDVRLSETVEVRMRWVPRGTLMMGSPEDEVGRFETEGPLHEVTLTGGLWISETPCTQAQWFAVMGTEPSGFKGDARPVEQVSWKGCVDFCERLRSKVPGIFARLPTEAEWEYACRAGKRRRGVPAPNTAFNDGSSCTEPQGQDPALMKLGWFGGNSGGETHPVKQLRPNDWGLYDMHGNVFEWCADWYDDYSPAAQTDPQGPDSGHGRVIRGGSFGYDPRLCRSAYRSVGHPGGRGHNLGFRFVSV